MNAHKTVLADEAVRALMIRDNSVVIDATLGSSGHALRIAGELGKEGTLIGIDADATAITNGESVLKGVQPKVVLTRGNFKNLDSILNTVGVTHVDAILADLGWRMEQFSGSGKGFSFQVDEPLFMTFGDPGEYPFTARDIVNEWQEIDIRNVLRGYGEERFAGRIARHIVEAREQHPIETTSQLVSIIEGAVPGFYRRGRIHPATRSFQALRIAVNDEFTALEEFITQAVTALTSRGRLAIITFHSIEDRIVKHRFRDLARDQVGTVVTKRPVTAGDEELKENPRARSAKLRIFEKI